MQCKTRAISGYSAHQGGSLAPENPVTTNVRYISTSANPERPWMVQTTVPGFACCRILGQAEKTPGLMIPELSVQAAAGNQFAVGALLCDPTLVKYDQPVHSRNG